MAPLGKTREPTVFFGNGAERLAGLLASIALALALRLRRAKLTSTNLVAPQKPQAPQK